MSAVQFDRFLVRIAAEVRAFNKSDSQGRPAAGANGSPTGGSPIQSRKLQSSKFNSNGAAPKSARATMMATRMAVLRAASCLPHKLQTDPQCSARFVEKYVCPQLYALLGNVEGKLEKQKVSTARASPDAAAMRKHLDWQQAQMSPVQPLAADPHQPEFYMPQVMSRKDPESVPQVMRHVSVADSPGIYPDPVQFFNQMDLASKSHNPTQHK